MLSRQTLWGTSSRRTMLRPSRGLRNTLSPCPRRRSWPPGRSRCRRRPRRNWFGGPGACRWPPPGAAGSRADLLPVPGRHPTADQRLLADPSHLVPPRLPRDGLGGEHCRGRPAGAGLERAGERTACRHMGRRRSVRDRCAGGRGHGRASRSGWAPGQPQPGPRSRSSPPIRELTDPIRKLKPLFGHRDRTTLGREGVARPT